MTLFCNLFMLRPLYMHITGTQQPALTPTYVQYTHNWIYVDKYTIYLVYS